MRCSRSRRRTTYVAPSIEPLPSAVVALVALGGAVTGAAAAGVGAVVVVATGAAGAVVVAVVVVVLAGAAAAGAAAAGAVAVAGLDDAAAAGAAGLADAAGAGACAQALEDKMVTAANAARQKLFLSRIGFPSWWSLRCAQAWTAHCSRHVAKPDFLQGTHLPLSGHASQVAFCVRGPCPP
ncbi:MAG: hypothetical protein EOO73_25945 [Myxococcales bacterium]|nr:MAG: hypothetical protein EOO73_25945 [Myxococcales bacterium]